MDDFMKLTHSNYHAWAPQMTAELQRLRVWHFCMGDESIPTTKPIALTVLNNAGIAEKATLDRNFTDTMCSYSDACCYNDQAIGLIMTKVKLSEYKDLENKSAKEVWDTLKTRHADMHTGVATFFIKVGMLQKKYNDGDDMNMHLTFFTIEN